MKSKTTRPPKIAVRNLQSKILVNLVDLRKFVPKALALCLQLPTKKRTDLEALREVSVLIVSDRRMAALHHRFMNESGPTDVMTFQHGEIFISADTAVRNARRFGNPLRCELRLYVIHGLLHLEGFDDRDPASTRKMRLAEKKIFRELEQV
jgi:probable rRNA maturation factor